MAEKTRSKLSMSEKFSRLALRLRDPEWRRYGGVLIAGKLLGIAAVLLAIKVSYGSVLHHGDGRRSAGCPSRRHRQSDQHGLDAAGRVPRLRHAGRLHHARGGLLPLARNRQRADGVHRRHLPLRPAVLRLWLRLHVQPRQRLHRLPLVLPAGRPGHLRDHRRRRSWPSGSSSSPSPTPAPPSPRAR